MAKRSRFEFHVPIRDEIEPIKTTRGQSLVKVRWLCCDRPQSLRRRFTENGRCSSFPLI